MSDRLKSDIEDASRRHMEACTYAADLIKRIAFEVMPIVLQRDMTPAPQPEAAPSRDEALRADQVAICSPSCTFAEAFAASREAGYGQFEWRGKLYHARTESEDRQLRKTPVIVGSRAALEDRT